MRNPSVFYQNNEGLLKEKNFPKKISNKKRRGNRSTKNKQKDKILKKLIKKKMK